jgi:hypothetical protein
MIVPYAFCHQAVCISVEPGHPIQAPTAPTDTFSYIDIGVVFIVIASSAASPIVLFFQTTFRFTGQGYILRCAAPFKIDL